MQGNGRWGVRDGKGKAKPDGSQGGVIEYKIGDDFLSHRFFTRAAWYSAA